MIKVKDLKFKTLYVEGNSTCGYIYVVVTSFASNGIGDITIGFDYFDSQYSKAWLAFPPGPHSAQYDLPWTEWNNTLPPPKVAPPVSCNNYPAKSVVIPDDVILKPLNPKKQIIPENKTSKYCIKCKNPNKEIVLFRSTTFYCPVCEP